MIQTFDLLAVKLVLLRIVAQAVGLESFQNGSTMLKMGFVPGGYIIVVQANQSKIFLRYKV